MGDNNKNFKGQEVGAWWETDTASLFKPNWEGGDLVSDWAKCSLTNHAMIMGETLHRAGFSGHVAEEYKDELREHIEELKGTLVLKTHYEDEDERSGAFVYVWADTVLDMSIMGSNVSASILTMDEEFIQQCVEIFQVLKSEIEVEKASVFVLGAGPQGGMEPLNLGVGGCPLERENYTPEVLEGYDKIKQDLQSPTPLGRLGVLTGPPGTGKTYLIRGLVEEVSALFVIIPAGMISHLGDPSLVTTLLQTRLDEALDYPIVLVVEDADMALLPRATDNLSAISNMLNASSGIVGDLIDIRIIATTNAKTLEIEPALMREGRLSAELKVEELVPSHAAEVHKRLTGKKVTFNSAKSLADVYALARTSGWIPPTKAATKRELECPKTVRKGRRFNDMYGKSRAVCRSML
jgi:hypothetical protein